MHESSFFCSYTGVTERTFGKSWTMVKNIRQPKICVHSPGIKTDSGPQSWNPIKTNAIYIDDLKPTLLSSTLWAHIIDIHVLGLI